MLYSNIRIKDPYWAIMQGRLFKKKYAYPGALIRQGRLIGMGRLFRHLRQPRVKVNKGLQWGNVKQRPFRQIYTYSRIFLLFQAHSDIFSHNQIFSGILKTYSNIFRTLFNTSILRTLVY